ncbi:hypothetical protein EB001_07300 [bacterium]|nr:hypothetical protein [bacterium]
MRIAIIGDSFTYTYKDTWIQTLVETLNLKLIHQSGFPGHSEFRIYKEFKIIINSNNLPDVILICHTEHARLYNPTIPIKPSFSNNLKYDILNKKTDFIKIVNNYYEFLYDSEYSSVMHNFIIKDIQEICRDKNIKLINIPCFEHDFVEKNYGLWFLTK